jgi:hypothetical protein
VAFSDRLTVLTVTIMIQHWTNRTIDRQLKCLVREYSRKKDDDEQIPSSYPTDSAGYPNN